MFTSYFSVAVSANRMQNNGLLGEYKIRERTKVTSNSRLIFSHSVTF